MIEIYELVTVMIPIIMYCILRKKEMSSLHLVGLLIFGVYLFGVFHFTGSGTFYELKRNGIEMRADQLNLKLFGDTSIVHNSLNIMLFVPLGFLVPFIWLRYNKLHYILFFGFSLSLLVEISQLFNHRSTDVDDLLLNVIGAIIGFILYRIYAWFTKRFYNWFTNQLNQRKIDISKYEIYLLVLSAFLSRFFLYNEMGMARLIYGF